YGVEENTEKALYWLTQAAEQGVSIAQYGLSRMYEEGEGVEENK
ncbi:sel1 repeat family protein, partial [Gilliamella sp. B3493]|nr:sel1 repeat family protein [Gilliamella sp. B3493]